MRYVEDQGDGRPHADAPPRVVSAGAALVSAALGAAYAAGAGLQHGQIVVSVMMALAAVFHLGWAGWALAHPEKPLMSIGAAVLVGFALQAGVPAVLGGHVHGDDSEQARVASGDQALGEPPADAGQPDDGDQPDHGPQHEHGAQPDHGDQHGDRPVVSLYDPRLTDDQREAARALIAETTEGMAAFPDIDSVTSAGYLSIGDSITGYEHFIHPGYIADGVDLDPSRIESIVAQVNLDGSKEIVSAMYLLGPGRTMDDAPDIAGPLTVWHDHQDLCWDGIRVVGRVGPGGSCARGEFRGTAPMMHVWLVPHPCGPFAGLEGHGGSCTHEH